MSRADAVVNSRTSVNSYWRTAPGAAAV